MKLAWGVRLLVAAGVLALGAWFVAAFEWVEIDEPIPPADRSRIDRLSAFRRIVASTGARLEVRHGLEPLPPAGATLLLDSAFWDVFPERDARLRGWVAAGGHLVIGVRQIHDDTLAWVPVRVPRNAVPAAKAASAASAASAAKVPSAASGAGAVGAATPAGAASAPAMNPKGPSPALAHDLPPFLQDPSTFQQPCLKETQPLVASAPAGASPRVLALSACVPVEQVRPRGVAASWTLGGDPAPYALRLPVGRGDVTVVASWYGVMTGTPLLMQRDHALITAEVLDLRPNRAVWLVEDESAPGLPAWLWTNARAALLLAAAAIVFALWRLMTRFGPLEAPPPAARRSAGEQVRGTAQFVAAHDPAALHAAARRAFEESARRRVPAWSDLDDGARVEALALQVGHALSLDRAALREALSPHAPSATSQWLAAVATLEAARRALLHVPPPPLV